MSDLSINQILDVQERGLHYGDGLFETLLMLNREIPLWDSHYDRLRRGCERLHIRLPDQKWLLNKINEEAETQDSVVLKIIVTRGSGGRGLTLPRDNQVSVFVLSYPYTAISEKSLELDVAICQTRLPVNPNLAGIKHLNRLDYVLAAFELDRIGKMNEAILCDTDGYIVEGIVSNLFFSLEDEIHTPSVEFAGVEGVMRRQIFKYFEARGTAVQVGRYSPEILFKSSECFMCNSVQGVRPIRSINGEKFSIGTISQMLMQTFSPHNKFDSPAAG